jgi:hypothetical protein
MQIMLLVPNKLESPGFELLLRQECGFCITSFVK